MTENEEFEYVAPAVVFPGQQAHEEAFRTAHDLLSRRFPVEALEILEPALTDHPDNMGLRSLRAWAYMLRAQLTKAETDLRWLVEQDPSDAWSQHSLGRVLERQDRLEDALGPLRLAAVTSDDYDHQAAVFRVSNRLAERQE